MILLLPRRLNGFSNMFWGWGGEDDDMAARLQSHGESTKSMSRIKFENSGMRIERYSKEIARYRMIKHKPEKPNKMRWSLLKSSQKRFLLKSDKMHQKLQNSKLCICRLKTDGLVSLEYNIVDRRREALFTELDVALTRTNGDVRGHSHFFHSKLGSA